VLATLVEDMGGSAAFGEDDDRIFNANDSLSAESLEIVRRANAFQLYNISDLVIRAQEQGFSGSRFSFGSDLRAAIMATYADCNAELVKHYGDEFADFLDDSKANNGVDLTGVFPVDYALYLLSFAF